MTPLRVLFLLLATTVVTTSCSKIENPVGVRLEDIITVRITGPTAIRADGVSQTTVQAEIPADATTRNVKFTTTRGSFVGADLKQEITAIADEDGVAVATIIAARDPGIASVTATVGTFVAATSLTHERAHADVIAGETTSAFVTLTGTVRPVVTALLTRRTGQVSPGTRVTFEAFQRGADGVERSVGRFFSITSSDASGKATASFSVDTKDASTDRPVFIRMSTPTDAGGMISTEILLRVE